MMDIEDKVRQLEAELIETKKRNHELEKKLAFDQNLLSKTGDSIFVHDLEGNWFYVNQTAYVSRGYTKEEFMQLSLSDIEAQDLPQTLPEKIAEIRKDGYSFFESQHLCKDGSWMHVEVSSTIIEHAGREYVLSDVRDITSRKETESTLKAIFDTVDSSIILVDKEGTISFANQMAAKMFSAPLEEVIGSQYLDHVQKEQRGRSEESMFALLEGNIDSVDYERLYRRRDGSTFWGHLSGKRYGPAENPKLVGIIHDITERKKLDIMIQEAYSNISRLIEESPDTIVVHDKQGQIESANKAGYELLGVAGKASGRNISEFIADEDKEKIFRYLASRMKGEEAPNTYSGNLKAEDGSIVPVEISATTIEMSGETRAVAYIKDMTGRVKAEKKSKELEKELHQSQKMEALGTLTGGIAHDFNNILSIMMGNAELVEDEMAEYSPGRYNIEQILEAGKRARDIIRQLLIFSRPESEEKVATDMYGLIRDSAKLLRASLPSTIEMFYTKPSEPMIAMANPTQIQQVILNLSSNAMHAMEETGGVIEYNLDAIKAKEEMEPGTYVMLSVKDTGKGISKDNIEKIFDPYFTTKGVDKGSGIGLSVVKGIIDGHGGYIDVESEPEKGTEFNVYLKAAETKLEQRIEKDYIPEGSESILIVDDKSQIADMLTRQIESLGYTTTKRMSSLDALEAFKANPKGYDLVLTDMTMPNMQGDQLAAKIRQIRDDIPIILHTGYSDKSSRDKTEQMGIAYLQKPSSKKDIAVTIRKELDRSR